MLEILTWRTHYYKPEVLLSFSLQNEKARFPVNAISRNTRIEWSAMMHQVGSCGFQTLWDSPTNASLKHSIGALTTPAPI